MTASRPGPSPGSDRVLIVSPAFPSLAVAVTSTTRQLAEV